MALLQFPLIMANGNNDCWDLTFGKLFTINNWHKTHSKVYLCSLEEENRSWIVVVTFSIGYDSMFQNWLHWFQKLDLDMKLIVIAEDDEVMKKYANEGSFSVMSFDLPKLDTNETSFLFDSQEFNQITARRYLMILV